MDYNKKNKNYKYDYIFINDGSTDNSGKILDENNIRHIDLIFNLGIGGAVQTGFKYAYNQKYDVAVQFDGDLQHKIEFVSNIVNPIVTQNINIVIGSRFIEKKDAFLSSRSRRVGIQIISKAIKLKTGKTIKDVTSGFRAIDIRTIELFCKEYPYEYPEPISTVRAITSGGGLAVKEISVEMNKRQAGKSSINSWKSMYYMFNVLISIIIMRKENKNE